jgi:hypothetical protein
MLGFLLPGGKHFIYSDVLGKGIYVGSLDASPPRVVSSEFAGNVAFAAGHLLYGRDRSLRAQLLRTTGQFLGDDRCSEPERQTKRCQMTTASL